MRHACIGKKKKQSPGKRCRNSAHNRGFRGAMIKLDTTTIFDRPVMVQIQDRSQFPDGNGESVAANFQTVPIPFT